MTKRGKASREEGGAAVPQAAAPLVSARKPLVFISHDSRDAELAEAFGLLLGDASGGFVKSFRSSDRKGTSGIEFGEEWYSTIMSKLGEATDVVAILTQNSLDRPWILYEVGVAKGKLDTPRAFGVAIGIPLEKASTGPFAQFMNCGDDEDSLTKLVLDLIKRAPEAEPRREAVLLQVKAFRDKVAGILKTRSKAPTTSPHRVDETAIAKLFEEVKVMFKALPERVEGQLRDSFGPGGPRRGRPFHPMMMEEIIHDSPMRGHPDGAAAAWLIAVSSVRDDVPWLYEAGMDVYRSMQSRRPADFERAMARFEMLVETTARSKAVRHMAGGRGDEMSMMMAMELPHMLRHHLKRLRGRGGSRTRSGTEADTSPTSEEKKPKGGSAD
jgi:hypothetical protein